MTPRERAADALRAAGQYVDSPGWDLLADEIERHIKEALNEQGALVYVPGDWVCTKCSCRLHSRVLFAQTGAVGVNAAATAETCPNGCAEMQPLTWKQDAEEANRAALDFLKENRRLRERLDELEPCH